MEKSKVKPILGVSISPLLYQRLKKEIGDRKVSAFVEKAIVAELGKKDKEKQKLKQQLIKDYQAVARSQKRKAEDEIWDETTSDGLK